MSINNDTTDDPTSDDYRRSALEERRDLFERIRDDESLPQQIRYQYGQVPLELLDGLQEGSADA
jgi:hypothetical protein